MDTAIVSGVGPLEGIGARLCLRFAKLGLHVFAAGRTQSSRDDTATCVGLGARGSGLITTQAAC